MRDLADDLRDYFDALVPPEAGPLAPVAQPPRRRQARRVVVVAIAAALAVAATLVIVTLDSQYNARQVQVGPASTSDEPVVAESTGVRLTLRLVGTPPPGTAGGTFTVQTTIENVGPAPVPMWGQLEPDPCHGFPVQVEAVRTAWQPGDDPWPGADHYLGRPVTGPGWSNIESRGSPFVDPLVEQARQATIARDGAYLCDLALHIGSLAPGERAQRTFTWTPPTGWPGGRHELVARFYSADQDVRRPSPVTARIQVDVHTDVQEAMGPAEALRRLAADPAFTAETTDHLGLMGVSTQWSPAAWTIPVQYQDSLIALWTVDQQGRVTKRS